MITTYVKAWLCLKRGLTLSGLTKNIEKKDLSPKGQTPFQTEAWPVAKLVFSFLTLLILVSEARAQHDPGRDSIRLIARDQIDQALQRLQKSPKSSNSSIDDPEQAFVSAIAACAIQDTAAAKQHLKDAIELGLPAERIVAGPKDRFAILNSDPEFRQWLDSLTPTLHDWPLIHGPMLSKVTDRSAGFWLRTAGAGEVQVRLRPLAESTDPQAATAEASEEQLSEKMTTSKQTDFVAKVSVGGLNPATRYQYQVQIDGSRVTDWIEFETFPTIGMPAKFKIAFGGGAGFTPQYHSMWTTIAKRRPLAMFMLGDNVYIDDPEHALTQHYCYYRRQSEPLWRTFIASTCLFSIYDDHDFGTDDCHGGPEIDRPAWKRPVWEVFQQNWNNPGYGGGQEQPGCWYDFSIGDVHFIMLDGRYYRDPKGGSMLGPVQLAWLEETLKGSAATFKVLVSPVPWSPGVKPGSKDTWDGFASEREQIFSLIDHNRIDGVVLMAADRHRSDLRRIPRRIGTSDGNSPSDGRGYDLIEMMSSRLTNVHTHPLMENAKGSEFIMGYNQKCSFGQVEFDTTMEDPSIRYSIISIDNEVMGQYTIRLSEVSQQQASND